MALSRASGSGVSAIIDGKRFLLNALVMRDYGIVENEILATRDNPVEVARRTILASPQSFSDRDADYLLTRAYEDARNCNKVSDEEILKWVDSRRGLAFTLWLSIQKTQVVDCEWLERVVMDMNPLYVHDLIRRRDIAAGVDEFCSYDWAESRPSKNETALEWQKRRNVEKVEIFQTWRYIYRELGENYGWASPQEIGDLTWYQARMVMCDKKMLGGRQKISQEDAAKSGFK